MEFNEKLQQLRKQENLTQEELAELLFVSRTAISKWESGRGLPNIDSLKAISNTFSVSIDNILSGEEIIQAAEDDKKESAVRIRTSLYGLMDSMCVILFFIPLFGKNNGEWIENVSLISLNTVESYIFLPYVGIVGLIVLFGIAEIILQGYQNKFWKQNSTSISIMITIVATTMFIVSPQPYIAFIMLWILVMKGSLYIKQQ